MPDPTPPEPEPSPEPEPEPPAPEPEPTPEPDDLGDAGKKAIAAERKKAADAEKRAKAAEKELEKAREAQLSEQEKAVAAARREGADEATGKANERLIKAEVRAAASGKMQDPSDALAHLDMASFTVGDDGEVDTEAITSAIDALLTDKPYLAGATPVPPVPGVPTGARPGGGGQTLDQQIEAARKAGNVQQVIALETSRLADAKS